MQNIDLLLVAPFVLVLDSIESELWLDEVQKLASQIGHPLTASEVVTIRSAMVVFRRLKSNTSKAGGSLPEIPPLLREILERELVGSIGGPALSKKRPVTLNGSVT